MKLSVLAPAQEVDPGPVTLSVKVAPEDGAPLKNGEATANFELVSPSGQPFQQTPLTEAIPGEFSSKVDLAEPGDYKVMFRARLGTDARTDQMLTHVFRISQPGLELVDFQQTGQVPLFVGEKLAFDFKLKCRGLKSISLTPIVSITRPIEAGDDGPLDAVISPGPSPDQFHAEFADTTNLGPYNVTLWATANDSRVRDLVSPYLTDVLLQADDSFKSLEDTPGANFVIDLISVSPNPVTVKATIKGVTPHQSETAGPVPLHLSTGDVVLQPGVPTALPVVLQGGSEVSSGWYECQLDLALTGTTAEGTEWHRQKSLPVVFSYGSSWLTPGTLLALGLILAGLLLAKPNFMGCSIKHGVHEE
jgi:hypothetical protein